MGVPCIDHWGDSMSDITLVPAAFRCPDHDNVELLTERVVDQVDREAQWFTDRTSETFRVSVVCPGSGHDQLPHRRVFDGRWTRTTAAVPRVA
ncbi:hypothetical protein AVP41_01484 [Microbacterium sp. TNHR37B]|nr:hypothetical protein AVP41_01484 [Microbacterium sp. TNHR37B]